MRVALSTICFNEERFIEPFLKHVPDWVEKKLVLVSSKPWYGKQELPDNSAQIAKKYAEVIQYYWESETDQRNAGQDYLSEYDWIIVLDPDEFLTDEDWATLKDELELATERAFVVEHQRVFWKDKEVYPHTDYQQIIAVRPSVRFIEHRVVDTQYATLPVELLHFSWARTDDEIWRKISHYSHTNEFDKEKWYEEVWLGGKTENLHPLTPETLKALIPAKLPKKFKELLCSPNKT